MSYARIINDSARYCYETVGFQPMGKIDTHRMAVGEWDCIEKVLSM